jgi:hypothetical protein
VEVDLDFYPASTHKLQVASCLYPPAYSRSTHSTRFSHLKNQDNMILRTMISNRPARRWSGRPLHTIGDQLRNVMRSIPQVSPSVRTITSHPSLLLIFVVTHQLRDTTARSHRDHATRRRDASRGHLVLVHLDLPLPAARLVFLEITLSASCRFAIQRVELIVVVIGILEGYTSPTNDDRFIFNLDPNPNSNPVRKRLP